MHPPKTLNKQGRDFWKGVMVEWQLTEKHDLALLEQAATCLDRIENARIALRMDGEYQQKGFLKVAAFFPRAPEQGRGLRRHEQGTVPGHALALV